MTPVDAGPSGLGMREMARLTPNGVLDVIPDAGHLILGQEAGESTRRIADFLLEA